MCDKLTNPQKIIQPRQSKHIKIAWSLHKKYCSNDKSYPDSKVHWQTWGPPGSCRPQVGPMLASWTLLSGHAEYSKHGSPQNSAQLPECRIRFSYLTPLLMQVYPLREMTISCMLIGIQAEAISFTDLRRVDIIDLTGVLISFSFHVYLLCMYDDISDEVFVPL